MRKEPTEEQLEAWRSLLTVHAILIERIDRELVEEGGLPLHWYDVLIELAGAPERRLRMHELARSVLLSRSGLTRLVDRLEDAGFLRRQPDPQDRRGAYAVLTDDGMAALRKSWPTYAAGISTYFAEHLSEEEVRTLSAAFGRILNAARES
jgi:DNA-binding MarR family transcriptional regulator